MLLTTLAWLGLAAWLGAMLLFAAVTAPTVFRTLDSASAGRFLRRLFPRYYAFGLAASLLYLVATVGLVTRGEVVGGIWLIAGGVFLVAAVVASLALIPAINAARDAGVTEANRFRRLHHLSVLLNLLSMVVTLGLVPLLVRGLAA